MSGGDGEGEEAAAPEEGEASDEDARGRPLRAMLTVAHLGGLIFLK